MKQKGLPIPVYVAFALFAFIVFATFKWIMPWARTRIDDSVQPYCLAHTWNEATCETPKTCTRCGMTKGDPLGHAWGRQDVEKAATCEKYGVTAKTCIRCGAVDKTTIDALGHDYQEWVLEAEPTCSANGMEVSMCSRCGHKETRSVDMLPHEAATQWTDKGFSEADNAGVAELRCKNCMTLLQKYLYDPVYSGLTPGGEESLKIGGFPVWGTISAGGIYWPVMAQYSHEALTIGVCMFTDQMPDSCSGKLVLLMQGKEYAMLAQAVADGYDFVSAVDSDGNVRSYTFMCSLNNMGLSEIAQNGSNAALIIISETENSDIFESMCFMEAAGRGQ